MCFKKFFTCLAVLLYFFFCVFPVNVFAEEYDTEDIYREQYEISGADKIIDSLPKDTQKYLNDLGIYEPDSNSISSISFQSFLSSILSAANESFKSSGFPLISLLGIILLSAFVYSLKLSAFSGGISEIVSIAVTLSISASIIIPISSLVKETADVIASSSSFMLIYVPVLAGLMLSAGQTMKGTSYYSLMMLAGQGVSQISNHFIVPLLNIFLGLSIVSSISSGLNLNGICNMFAKVIKWVLSFVMSVFVSLLTIQGLITSSADTAGSRAVRFAVRSFVPVVGGALSDAYLSVQGCVTLLKSGVGIVAMLGTGFIYLPVLFKCIFWLFTLYICSAAAQVFDLKTECTLLEASAKVISTLIAILLCCMAVFIISTAIILIVGGN